MHILYNSAGDLRSEIALHALQLFVGRRSQTPNGARAAAFGSGPRPFLGYDNGLRPLPSAAAFGRFVTRSLSEENNTQIRSRLPALLILLNDIISVITVCIKLSLGCKTAGMESVGPVI